MFRQLSTTEGRWTSPDPAGMGAVSPGDPQSWNRYAYVSNNPLNAVDPVGLFGSDAECSGIACDYFLQQLDASNRSIDFSFDSFVKWNAQHTFDDQGNSLWSQLPGKSNPIREGLEDYLDNPFISAPGIEGYTPDEGSSGPGTGQCSDRIVGALNGVLGTNFTTTNVAKVFPAGIRTAQNILMNSNGVSLTAAQFNAIQPGARWSLNPGFLGSVLGIGPALHIADPNSLFDRKFAQFDASNNGGQLSINTMVLHIDDGNSHLPGGFFEHLFRDVIFRNRPPCP